MRRYLLFSELRRSIMLNYSLKQDDIYLLIGPISCVCTVVFTLWDFAGSGSIPGRVLHLQHRGTRGAELSETALKVLIQVAIKNWVQATARGRNKVRV